jgi:predicted ATPase
VFSLEEGIKKGQSVWILGLKEKFQRLKKDYVIDLSSKVQVHIQESSSSNFFLRVEDFEDQSAYVDTVRGNLVQISC